MVLNVEYVQNCGLLDISGSQPMENYLSNGRNINSVNVNIFMKTDNGY